ncbi:MAG: thiamine pyrophosphate-requiring protein [Alphaproteobacteria bacterium]
MGRRTIDADSVAEAYLALLADRGIDYLFGNAGTDFASIIEALSKSALGEGDVPLPTPIMVPHENLAVAMAHGYYVVSGRPQAVMFHVNVGTANGICGVANAARDNVPLLFTSGRTPINEGGVLGARNNFIHWGQEMFDQAGMLREFVKWDYELRGAEQLETVVDRALNMAMTEPRGPIYLSLPREVLASPANGAAGGGFAYDSPSRHQPASPPGPDTAAVAQAAEWLAGAEKPLIVTVALGRDAAAVEALGDMAGRFAIPVAQFRPRYVCLPTDHPMHVGYEPKPLLEDADVILVLEADVPWIPDLHKLNPEAKVIHAGNDPLFGNIPIRGFPCDLAITATPRSVLGALTEAMAPHENEAADRIAARRGRIAKFREALRRGWREAAQAAGASSPPGAGWIATCLNQAKGEDDIIFCETTLPLGALDFTRPGTYFGVSSAGGLGWGLGASLGAKLAVPERRIFCVVGDGAYMFGGPTPAHYVSASLDLPVVTVIVNNSMWGAVRKATLGIHPDGAAARVNRAPYTYFEPTPDYEKVVEASGGYGEKVESADELPAALERAIKVVEEEKRQAVLNVITSYDDTQALADSRR